MPLNPDEIDPDLLPRTRAGGLKAGPVEELLKRVAWDYRQLLHDRQQLHDDKQQLHEQVAELEARAWKLERQLERLASEERQKQPDELARQVLAAAQRAARELRESAREQSELALKKARGHAEQIEEETYRDHSRAVAELRELEARRRAIQERLRASLTAALAHSDGSRPVPALDTELVGRLESAESAVKID